jgi:uncharacterized protein
MSASNALMALVMRLYRSQNIQDFCDRTQTFLLQHEAEHNLLLAIQQTLVQQPSEERPPYLGWCEVNGAVQGVAVHQPRRNVVLSQMSAGAARLFAKDIVKAECHPPGVAGLTTEVAAFVDVWQSLTQQPISLAMEMYIHQLMQVQPVSRARGQLRVARGCDRALVLDWSRAFDCEAFGQVQPWTEEVIDRQIQKSNIYLWQAHQPVSMAIGRGSTPGGGRIGPVYTPPEFRCQGYATACVAALSQRLLNQGYRSCFLFTDKTNPTSNHIYQTIGYRQQCNWVDYRFGHSIEVNA